ncbi:MAG: translation initiation factor IF-2 [Aestuariivita sp.]|nr:translation initiation factor IF-2 [Aestuariivita sp.]
MNEVNEKKTLGLRSTPRSGSVQQSFSHGRTNNVVVETKRKRVRLPRAGSVGINKLNSSSASAGGDPKRQRAGVNDSEMDRRVKAVLAARAREAEEKERRDAEEKLREEERARRRAEVEAKKKEELERAERAQRKAEEERARRANEGRESQTTGPSPEGVVTAKEQRTKGITQRKGDRDLSEDRPRSNKGRSDDSGRRSGKLTLNQVLAGSDGGRQRSMASMKRKQERARKKAMSGPIEREKVIRDVQLPETIVVSELANRMAERAADVVKVLIKNGMIITQNESIDADTAELIIEEFGHKAVRVSDADVEDVIKTTEDSEDDLKVRSPVVTVMGHVDHGKTSLLDAFRNTSVSSGEAGGITQHIGAYQVETKNGAFITFLDTPGHAAFTSMRARGAHVTDIVVLVVAADDSVMPQTVEAINHAKAADVPMIVAINKIDKPEANADKVRTELLQHEVIVEKLSGDVQDVEVSATTGKGLDDLLEAIVLQSEIFELKANPDRAAEGAVIEAKLDAGRGPVATVLVQKGTLRTKDIFVVGEKWGRVRAMENEKGERVIEAGPSVAVEVLGLDGAPEAGDVLNVVETESQAREIANYRNKREREKKAVSGGAITTDQIFTGVNLGNKVTELAIVVKADVQGSVEAIVQAVDQIGNDEVRVRVLHSGVGAITDTDIGLAEASDAILLGFNVRANASARKTAGQKGVDIRYYSVIYDLIDDVKTAASGLLIAEVREHHIGYAEIKEVFKVSGVGKVAGCLVTEGVSRKSAGVRLLRDNVVIHQGTLKTLKRFKDDVPEVQSGQECGMAFEDYNDIRQGDVIEIYESEEVARVLE